MVKVVGRTGKVVDIHVLGMSAVMDRLRRTGKEIESSADLGVVKAGGFVEEEVKESIMGHRAEPRSVETGRLGNSIQFNKTKKAEGVVKPKRDSYPNGQTTEEVATFMEYGGVNRSPRMHFRNTVKRNKGKVRDIINKEIRIGRL